MKIIEADVVDADLVGYIHSTAWKQAYMEMFPMEYLEADTPDIRAREFIESYKDKGIHYYLIYEDEMVIGIVKVILKENKVCEISSLYILAEYRNKGYGKQVVAYLRNVFRQEKIYLWVLEENVKARRFYENNGFNLTGKTKEINRGEYFTQLQYMKDK